MVKSLVLLVIASEIALHLPLSACYDCENPDLSTEHGLYVIKNVKPKFRNNDFAIGTTPPAFAVRLSTLPNAGLGAFAVTDIPANTRLGPYDGIIHRRGFKGNDWHYLWSVYYFELSDRFFHYVDAKPKTHSSWLRYVNMANTIKQENLYVYHYNYEVYYVTFECIKAGTELLVWYGDDYGRTLGLSRMDEDYIKRFGSSNEIRYLNTVKSAPPVQLSSGCYKYVLQCPYKKPKYSSENYTKTCMPEPYYDVCKFARCDVNPCSGVTDCRPCNGYCFHMGQYIRPNHDFEHADHVNACVCNANGDKICSGDITTYRDMCLY